MYELIEYDIKRNLSIQVIFTTSTIIIKFKYIPMQLREIKRLDIHHFSTVLLCWLRLT
jgi:hypothetical protein